MRKSDFFYELPEELIAQTPTEPRDCSRLLKVKREDGGFSHDFFYNLAESLNAGDLLIMNDSKVFPARLLGKKRGSGVATEFLLLEQKSTDTWETMVCPGRRLKKGAVVDFGGAEKSLSAEIIADAPDGNRIVQFHYGGEHDFFALLDEIGLTPLPPYITEKLSDSSRYNTIYAKEKGSAAAPTAGLHFTERVFSSLEKKGIQTAYVTLHVGLGTFRPVKAENISEHKMHTERYIFTKETACKIRDCKARGNRVIAVGTTSCRVLESVEGVSFDMPSESISGDTDIFITPGYEFKVIDGLITNFHLPESSLIMLVSAFLSHEKTLEAYREAIAEKYRFFSFGDAMLIL
ncbi:MAG: tRNA preQ1(34) S-adenosylmethionine ribosyltransferase-isomerase QueA [Oscillospiraceae bacterium]|nr:tRNA preQ1(34) S-adenosylmethionine ribosyltransferase-isomerase QueA [Oscillospiraceae bacterium]